MSAGCSTIGALTKGAEKPPIPLPAPPKVKMQSVAEAIGNVTNLVPKVTGEESLPNFKEAVLGVNNFEGDPKGGPSLSATLWLVLVPANRANQIRVVDREKIGKVTDELSRTDSSFINLSPSEKAKKLGQLIGCEFLFFGNVTEYQSSVQSITISEQYLPGEIERYQKDYDLYIQQFDVRSAEVQKKINDPGTALLGTRPQYEAELMKLQVARNTLKAPGDYDRMLVSRSQTASINLVGITGQLIDVKTGTTIWAFDADSRNLELDAAKSILVRAMVKSLFSKTPTMVVV